VKEQKDEKSYEIVKRRMQQEIEKMQIFAHNRFYRHKKFYQKKSCGKLVHFFIHFPFRGILL
jgi:hypothetical protein